MAAGPGGRRILRRGDRRRSGALNEALRVPYRVLDDKGQVVAQGLVDGAPVALPVGVYQVEILTNPVKVIDGVTVSSGKEMVVRVKGG